MVAKLAIVVLPASVILTARLPSKPSSISGSLKRDEHGDVRRVRHRPLTRSIRQSVRSVVKDEFITMTNPKACAPVGASTSMKDNVQLARNGTTCYRDRAFLDPSI